MDQQETYYQRGVDDIFNSLGGYATKGGALLNSLVNVSGKDGLSAALDFLDAAYTGKPLPKGVSFDIETPHGNKLSRAAIEKALRDYYAPNLNVLRKQGF